MKIADRYIQIADCHFGLTVGNKKFLKYLDSVYLFSAPPKKAYCNINLMHEGTRVMITGGGLRHIVPSHMSKEFKLMEFVVMSAFAFAALRKNILLLHGSSYERDNHAYIYFGRSGSGKSTIIRKTDRKSILSDDTAVVKKIGKFLYVYRSPFDKKKLLNLESRRAPLKKILFLNKSKEHSETDIQNTTKFIALKGSDIYAYADRWFFMKRTQREAIKLYALVLEIIGTTDIKRLNFTKD